MTGKAKKEKKDLCHRPPLSRSRQGLAFFTSLACRQEKKGKEGKKKKREKESCLPSSPPPPFYLSALVRAKLATDGPGGERGEGKKEERGKKKFLSAEKSRNIRSVSCP